MLPNHLIMPQMSRKTLFLGGSLLANNAMGTYRKDPASNMHMFVVVGAGGPGGNGASTAAATTRSGGGGGGGGASWIILMPSIFVPETIWVKAGGQSPVGTAGEATELYVPQEGSSSLVTLVTAGGGNFAGNGTSSAGSAGGSLGTPSDTLWTRLGFVVRFGGPGGGAGGSGFAVGNPSATPSTTQAFTTGGGGGGGCGSNNQSGKGGDAFATFITGWLQNFEGGAATGLDGQGRGSVFGADRDTWSMGGGSGGGGLNGTAGHGGNGAPGCGGGGGGGGITGGSGGKGGPGFVIVIEW